MENLTVSRQTDTTASAVVRLYYLDWLRVIATLGVFLFHISNVFSSAKFKLCNAESSDTIFLIASIFYPWAMPLFFLVAGAASWYAPRGMLNSLAVKAPGFGDRRIEKLTYEDYPASQERGYHEED
jgi:hypothetical protein